MSFEYLCKRILNAWREASRYDKMLCLLGKIYTKEILKINDYRSISDFEFSVYSQFGDDGIIQFLINTLEIENKYFIEFGVSDYSESNTRFLLVNNNWSGFVMDGSHDNIGLLRKSAIYWKYDIKAKAAHITKNNINALIEESGMVNIGLLHIDLDGIDYWIWDALNLGKINPVIVILEYNSLFGITKPITVPYGDNFNRIKAHYSNLYWGASLKALYLLSRRKGYAFIGCNSAGNNAYFIRNDKIKNLKKLTAEEGFTMSKFRESKNKRGDLSFVSGEKRLDLIGRLPVYNTETQQVEYL